MFNNRFTYRNDPLVEAVKQAQAEGEMRRKAEALVNEEFGVYSRKAVVREDLAAYDARIEEAYKCMKEGNKDNKEKKKEHEEKTGMEHIKKMGGFPGQSPKRTARELTKEEKADKDYDKDGKVESPKDEVWGSRLRAAKLAGKLKEEEELEEGRTTGNRSYKGSPDRKRKAVQMALGRKHKDHPDWNERTSPQYSALKLGRKLQKQGVTKEEADYSAQDRAPVTKSAPKEDPSTPKSYPGAASSLTAGNPTSQRMPNAKAAIKEAIMKQVARNPAAEKISANKVKGHPLGDEGRHANKGALTKVVPGQHVSEEQVDEAAYSAKAARAGKDIGKPGKQFAKIAKKAGEKYGSEERGKKVAGSILAKIRAKHMKEETLEELSAFGKAFASAKGQNFSFRGKEYSGARADGKTAKAPEATKAPEPTKWADPGKRDYSASNKGTEKSSAPAPSMATGGTTSMKMPSSLAGRDQEKDSANAETSARGIRGRSASTGEVSTSSFSAPGSAGSATGRSTSLPKDPGAAENEKRKTGSLNEAVQVGDRSYRIV